MPRRPRRAPPEPLVLVAVPSTASDAAARRALAARELLGLAADQRGTELGTDERKPAQPSSTPETPPGTNQPPPAHVARAPRSKLV